MYESSAARQNDEQDVPAVDTSPDVKERHHVVLNRFAMRDRLIRRVLEDVFRDFAEKNGQDELYIVGFETDPKRIWELLRFDSRFDPRFNVIRKRIERINGLKKLALTNEEYLPTFDQSVFYEAFLMDVRHDWKRGKIKQRQEQRHLRKEADKPNQEDLLWEKIR